MELDQRNSGELEKVILYAPANYGVEFLFTCIDVACRAARGTLSSEIPRPSTVQAEIVLLPFPQSFKRSLANIALSLFSGLPGFARGVALKFIPSYASTFVRAKLKHRGSLFQTVERGYEVHFDVAGTWISIRSVKVNLARRVKISASALLISMRLWLRTICSGKFIAQDFLELVYDRVEVGRLAASQTLRVKWKMGGSIRATSSLFFALASAVYLCKTSKLVRLSGAKCNLVMVPELTYLCAVYEQALSQKGANIVSLYSYRHTFEIRKRDEAESHPDAAERDKNTDDIDTTTSEQYLMKRLDEPVHALPYMTTGVNAPPRGEILTLNRDPVKLREDALSVVVFLHTVEDAQYYFGLDGFADIMDWSIFTIDKCLENENIDKVLVKMHPNIDLEYYRADKLAFERLLLRYSHRARCAFISSTTSLVDLASGGRRYGITHHGSVAEEFVYLGQPVVASVRSPWAGQYSFTTVWRNPEAYEQILKSLSFDKWSPPNELERAELMSFVQNYRLKQSDYRKKAAWRCLADLRDGHGAADTVDASTTYMAHMQRMVVGSPEFDWFLRALCSRPIDRQ